MSNRVAFMRHDCLSVSFQAPCSVPLHLIALPLLAVCTCSFHYHPSLAALTTGTPQRETEACLAPPRNSTLLGYALSRFFSFFSLLLFLLFFFLLFFFFLFFSYVLMLHGWFLSFDSRNILKFRKIKKISGFGLTLDFERSS